MRNTSIELDGARAILNTYQQVNDASMGPTRIVRSKLQQKNKELLEELNRLKEQYAILKKELRQREERLARLNLQLIDKSTHMARLQEDFENAIYQLTKKAGVKSETFITDPDTR